LRGRAAMSMLEQLKEGWTYFSTFWLLVTILLLSALLAIQSPYKLSTERVENKKWSRCANSNWYKRWGDHLECPSRDLKFSKVLRLVRTAKKRRGVGGEGAREGLGVTGLGGRGAFGALRRQGVE